MKCLNASSRVRVLVRLTRGVPLWLRSRVIEAFDVASGKPVKIAPSSMLLASGGNARGELTKSETLVSARKRVFLAAFPDRRVDVQCDSHAHQRGMVSGCDVNMLFDRPAAWWLTSR